MNKSRHLGPEEWRQIVDQQRASGLTVAAYCRDWGITEGSFYTWKRRLRATPRARSKRSPTPAFVEMKPLKTSTAETIEVFLAGDRRLLVRRGFDHDLLIDLIHTLEGAA
jgi:transposase-like protein